jgi:hypothetical protein
MIIISITTSTVIVPRRHRNDRVQLSRAGTLLECKKHSKLLNDSRSHLSGYNKDSGKSDRLIHVIHMLIQAQIDQEIVALEAVLV